MAPGLPLGHACIADVATPRHSQSERSRYRRSVSGESITTGIESLTCRIRRKAEQAGKHAEENFDEEAPP